MSSVGAILRSRFRASLIQASNCAKIDKDTMYRCRHFVGVQGAKTSGLLLLLPTTPALFVQTSQLRENLHFNITRTQSPYHQLIAHYGGELHLTSLGALPLS